MRKDIPQQQKGKTSGHSLSIIGKIDFNARVIFKNEEKHYIIIKGSIQKEEMTIVQGHAPSARAPGCFIKMASGSKGSIDSTIIIMGYFRTTPSLMDILTRHMETEKYAPQ